MTTHFSEHELASALIRSADKRLRRASASALILRMRAKSLGDAQHVERAQLLTHATFFELEAQRAQRDLVELERLCTWSDGQRLRKQQSAG